MTSRGNNTALWGISRTHWSRRVASRCAFHPLMEAFILGMIVLNAAVIGMADFSVHGPISNEPVVAGSWRNAVVEQLQLPFLVIFTIETALKILALGLFCGEEKRAYLRDAWNWLDFIVVVTGWLESIEGMPSVSLLRVFRVLRPLRALTRVPTMKALVAGLLRSLRPLASVAVLAAAAFFLFAVMSLQLWGLDGLMYGRCRSTAAPVLLRAAAMLSEASTTQAIAAATDRGSVCLPGVPLDSADWTKDSSPWATPQPCVWPIGSNGVCALPGRSGVGVCPMGEVCGSNYDHHGNPRFALRRVMELQNAAVPELVWGEGKGVPFFSHRARRGLKMTPPPSCLVLGISGRRMTGPPFFY